MKKIILSFSLLLLITSSFLNIVCAEEIEESNLEKIVSINENKLEDGLKEEIIIKEYVNTSSSKSISQPKSGSKTLNVKDENNNILWSLTVYGDFLYDGYTSSCTSSRISTSVNDTNWRITSSSSNKTSNSALGYATGKLYYLGVVVKTLDKSVTLTCSKNGTLS